MAAQDVQWEIETDDGWVTFKPDVPFHGRRDEEIRFGRGRFQYRVAFAQANEGIQENLTTGKTRRLRRIEAPACPKRSGSDLERAENLRLLRQQLLRRFPQVADEAHPVHATLARARAAEETQRWEVAFNELFAAEESLSCASVAEAKTASAATSSSARPDLKRTTSAMLGEATGEPRRVARRLLDEAGGNEAEAFERSLLMRDLEQGRNSFACQVELNCKAVECLICTEQVEIREAVRLQPCKHGWYCVSCLQRAADAKMSDGATANMIQCPECSHSLSEALLRALLTKNQMDRLHRQSLESAVASCEALRPCPTPDCPNRVVLEDGVQARLRCELCCKEHCLLCSSSPFHVGKTCEEHLAGLKDADAEIPLRKWMAQVGAKQCPKCRAIVTKHNLQNQSTQKSECHKMICRGCRTKFCFKCLAVLTEVNACGCTPDSHGFIDPDTGAFVQHLAPRRQRGQRR